MFAQPVEDRRSTGPTSISMGMESTNWMIAPMMPASRPTIAPSAAVIGC